MIIATAKSMKGMSVAVMALLKLVRPVTKAWPMVLKAIAQLTAPSQLVMIATPAMVSKLTAMRMDVALEYRSQGRLLINVRLSVINAIPLSDDGSLPTSPHQSPMPVNNRERLNVIPMTEVGLSKTIKKLDNRAMKASPNVEREPNNALIVISYALPPEMYKTAPFSPTVVFAMGVHRVNVSPAKPDLVTPGQIKQKQAEGFADLAPKSVSAEVGVLALEK